MMVTGAVLATRPTLGFAQQVDEAATPVFFVRSTTSVDAQMQRAATGATIDRRAVSERLSLTARSRGEHPVRAHAAFEYWFDAGALPDETPERARHLEPALLSAWLDAQWRALSLRVGRHDSWGTLGFARIDGVTVAWRQDRGVSARVTAGVRTQPDRWRLDNWDYTPLGDPLDDRSSGVAPATLLESELRWRGRYGGVGATGQQRWRAAEHAGARFGADAWATPHSRIRLWASAVGDTSIAGVSSMEAGARRRGERMSLAVELRATRPLFEPSSTWMAYPLGASARLRTTATRHLDDGHITAAAHITRRYLRGWAEADAESGGGSLAWSAEATPRLQAELSASADVGPRVRWGVGRGRLSYACNQRTTLHATQTLRAAANDTSSRIGRAIGSFSQLTAVFGPDDRTTLAASTALTSESSRGVGWQVFLAADLRLPGARW